MESTMDPTMDPTMMMNGTTMMMQMTFYASDHVTLFFKSWVSNTPAAYTAMLACLIVLAVFYEWLGAWNRRREVELAAQWKSQKGESNIQTGLVSGKNLKRPRFGAKDQLARALVHVIKLLLSYFLMLAFMTYNVGVCAAVLVGAFIGFFIFQAEPYVEAASDAQSCH